MSRDSIRSGIFSNESRQFKKEIVKFFGQEIEIRQPALAMILDAQQTDNRRHSMAQMLVGYCFVPGTEEKVFEIADMDMLMTLPFGEDFSRVNEAITRMTSLNIGAEVKNSETTPNNGTSSL